MYLDRNGIMCDNIIELMPYVYTVLMNFAKDPYSTYTEPDEQDDIPWWAWLLFGIGAALVVAAATVLTLGALGVAVGATLHGAAVGTLIGAGTGAVGSALSQGFTNGFSNIDWGQVLIDGLSGAAIGVLMASPLKAVVTGIGVGVIGFTQSVITDAYTNDWDLSKVRWGNAVAFGALTGAVSGVGLCL